MRILFLSDAPSPHTRRWVEHFRDRGDEVHLASIRPYDIPGVSVHELSTFGIGKLGYVLNIPRLRALARRIKPEVVSAQHITSYGLLAALAQLRPLVMTAWGSDVLVTPCESRLLRWTTIKALAAADEVTTVAEHMNEALVELGVPSSKTQLIPFGVDRTRFRPAATRSESSVPLRIITTRNFSPIYDVSTIIRALRIVRDRDVPFVATLVGDGPLRAQLEREVDAANLTDVVTFTGRVEPYALAELLGAADVFLTASLSDGNNVSLTEAMSCGCFPIASDIPANRQWIDDGRNGRLFRVGNDHELATCIDDCVRNPSLRTQAFALNQKIIADRADWRTSVGQMERLFARMALHGGKSET